MFALNHGSTPRIGSYEAAKLLWESINPLRGAYDGNSRPLGRRASSNAKSIRRVEDSVYGMGYALRYHSTDVVIYYESGWIRIEGWPSRSTQVFVESVTGDPEYQWGGAFSADFMNHSITGVFALKHTAETVFFQDSVYVKPGEGKLKTRGAVKVLSPLKDMRVQRAIFKKWPQYAQFRDWAKAIQAFRPEVFERIPANLDLINSSHEQLLDMLLAGPQSYEDLASIFLSAKDATDHLREIILDSSGENTIRYEPCDSMRMLVNRCCRLGEYPQLERLPDADI